MSLRRDDTCASCAASVPAGSTAWWISNERSVYCVPCWPSERTPADSSTPNAVEATTTATSGPIGTPLPPPPPIEVGTAGISARQEYERRTAKAERQVEAKWGTGRVGRIAKALADEPSSTTAWAKGADGEQRLGRRLTDDLADVAVVLHDRRAPRTKGNIDHVVVAPSGIWIIDAKNYTGKVERRDVGGWLRTDVRLFVNNRDRTKLVEGLGWQVAAVRSIVEPIGFGHAPIRPALCFTNAEWGLFSKPIQMDDTVISWAKALVAQIGADGPLDPRTIDLLARELSSKLPAST
jgi:hypothetical protein